MVVTFNRLEMLQRQLHRLAEVPELDDSDVASLTLVLVLDGFLDAGNAAARAARRANRAALTAFMRRPIPTAAADAATLRPCRERARAIGGTLDASRSAGRFRVAAELPYRSAL